MTRLRTILILGLVFVPLALFVGVAAWSMWETGRLLWLWWLLPLCWGLAYALARRRAKQFEIDIKPEEVSALPRHWTDRDRSAFELVLARQRTVKELAPEQLTDPTYYFETALSLSDEIARHYHPKAQDPLSSLTLLEILAAAELAAEDLQNWVQNYVPGSHLLTINNWKLLGRVPDWAKTAGDVTWAVSILFDPLNLARYIASRATITPLTDQIQANILAAFYVAFIRRTGRYLVEMNSGRLRGGAARYRALLKRFEQGQAAAGEGPEVTIAVIGQCKAGKSSLINTLLREQQAATDVLPETREVQRYRLSLPDREDQLVILDTGGYADDGASPAQLKEMQLAYRQADLVLLVMDAKNPARDADLQMRREMAAWVDSQPTLKKSPVVGVLTHIDLLSPTMEWSPPYNWEQPATPKERNIREAVDYHHELFAGTLDGIVPLCSDSAHGRAFGADEWLLPVMIALLGDAQACSLVRTLHSEWDAGRVRTFMGQLLNAGNALLRVIADDVPQR